MTDAEWLGCDDPREMLRWLCGKASKRQECLLGVACCLRVSHLFEGKRFWVWAGPGECYLEQPGGLLEMTEHCAERCPALRLGEYGPDCPSGYADEGHATFAADAALYSPNAEMASWYASLAGALDSEGYEDCYEHFRLAPTLPSYLAERATQCQLLRDIIGNPFRPVACDSAWLWWNGGTVRALAQSAYDGRALSSGHLDATRLTLLADALEDAGCTEIAILEHLRGPGPHVRGCWVVDWVLGKV